MPGLAADIANQPDAIDALCDVRPREGEAKNGRAAPGGLGGLLANCWFDGTHNRIPSSL
jgi:hypothetical protein